MNNHLHVIMRSRPDVVAAWSDDDVVAAWSDDVARRWWTLFPGRRGLNGRPAEPTAADLAILRLPKAQARHRPRLSDVSWFMRFSADPRPSPKATRLPGWEFPVGLGRVR
jgi:hypothetical protein